MKSSRGLKRLTELSKVQMQAGRIVFTALAAILLTGCLFRPSAALPTRHFTLAPLATNDAPSATSEHLSIGIGFVRMPSYLLRNSMAVRNGNNEIEYLEQTLWAERLDHDFQQTLGVNLSRLLPADSVYLTDWARDQVTTRVFVEVQRFDVDTQGRGTLIASWRINAAEGDKPLKSGEANLAQTGPSPRSNPQAIATTLSALTAEFSRQLAEAIHESAQARP